MADADEINKHMADRPDMHMGEESLKYWSHPLDRIGDTSGQKTGSSSEDTGQGDKY